MALETRPMKALFTNESEPRTIPKVPNTCAMEPRDRESFPAGSIFGVPRKQAAPPAELDYPHWSDPVRVSECHFYDPPPRFQEPQPRKTPKAMGSQGSQSTRAGSSRSGGRSSGYRSSNASVPLTRKAVARHVREIQPWGGSNASSDKEKPYFSSIESVYEIRMGCRKLDGTPIVHGRAGIPSAKLRDRCYANFYNNPEYGGPHYKPKAFGHTGGLKAAGISTGGGA